MQCVAPSKYRPCSWYRSIEPICWQQKSLDVCRKKGRTTVWKKKHFPVKRISRCSTAALNLYKHCSRIQWAPNTTRSILYRKRKNETFLLWLAIFFSHSTHVLSKNFIGCEQNGYILEHNGKYGSIARDSHIYTYIKRTTMPLLCVCVCVTPKVDGGTRDKRDSWFYKAFNLLSLSLSQHTDHLDTFEYV